nr:MAG TPA: hypothetical protein [Caudoviricetes sp.]
MDYSKMSIDQLREVIAWADDRAAYRRACATISGASYAEDESAARAALAEISRREYRAREAEFLTAPALCEHVSPSKCDCSRCGARDLCAWLCEHDPNQ